MDDGKRFKLADIIALSSVFSFIVAVTYIFGFSVTSKIDLMVYLDPSDYIKIAIK